MGAAALRTTNPLLLAMIIAVVGYVVATCRSDAPWSASFGAFLRLAAVVVIIRIVFQILFGMRSPGTVLFEIPSVPLPEWAGGVSIGGPVTAEAIVLALYQGLRLAVVIVCFGAASSLASPYRLLRSLPAVLYEAGVAVTVAITFAPQVIMRSGEIREARRLRGRPVKGPAGWMGTLMPVLEGALDRAIALAASMDSRGYGRRGELSPAMRRVTVLSTLAGFSVICVGLYLLMDASTASGFGLPALALGSLALAFSLVATGRRSNRTRYRPDPWGLREWVISVSGAVVLVALIIVGLHGDGLNPSVNPLEVPQLPVIAAAGILFGTVPAFVAPWSKEVLAETPGVVDQGAVRTTTGKDPRHRRPSTTAPSESSAAAEVPVATEKTA